MTISDQTVAGAIPSAVLDSNVVFDWLVFRHPAATPLARAIERGQMRWLCSAAMQDELAHVLARGVLDRWQPDQAGVWSAWARWAVLCPTSANGGEALQLRCRDPDDQKFIDLALACQARWLITRDRDLLSLARRARRLGLAVLTPEAWAVAATGAFATL